MKSTGKLKIFIKWMGSCFSIILLISALHLIVWDDSVPAGTLSFQSQSGDLVLAKPFYPVPINQEIMSSPISKEYPDRATTSAKNIREVMIITGLVLLVIGGLCVGIGSNLSRPRKKQAEIQGNEDEPSRIEQLTSALKESEERYRLLFEHPAFPISLLDAETGELVAFNKCAHEIHGYSSEEFEQLTFEDMELDVTAEERARRRKKIIEEGSILFEARHQTKTSGTIDLLVSSVAVDIEGKHCIQNIGVDITELKRTQEDLRKSENRFRQLVDSAPDALFLHDLDGRIIAANQSACESLGYSRDELIGLYIQDIDDKFILGKHLKKFKELEPGIPITFEGLQKRKDGTTFPAEIRLLIVEFDDRHLMLALVRDVTERKYAEEERKKLETQLAYAQRIQAIGTLAGGIAHNFNNLLMGIQGNVSLILFEKKPEDSDYLKLRNIQQLVENGAKLTNQLLGYAREGKYEVKPINLNKLIKETTGPFGATKKAISIHSELAENLMGIKADQGQIEQALLNLYINAADAMPGGGNLFLKTANITHRDMENKPYKPKPGNYVRFDIRDTGTGMDKETLDRIFDPFFTTKGFAQGTGLGLASVYGIIKGHGGYIEVDSEKDRGTSFTIFLPSTDTPIKEENGVTGEIIMGQETILFVDDEELILEAGEQMLQNLGYHVLLARNGKEAVDLFIKNPDPIDMVLLDMIMPDMGGGEAYDRMKEINPGVKVLLSSGYGLDGEAKEILDRGCNGFIQKPFRMKELSLKLREILNQ